MIKLPTKRIFRNFHIFKIDTMTPFCNLFMERPSEWRLLIYHYTTLYWFILHHFRGVIWR